MKALLCTVLGTALAAQSPEQPKIPREPSSGVTGKLPAAVPLQAPMPATAGNEAPAMPRQVADKPVADAASSLLGRALRELQAPVFDRAEADGHLWTLGSAFKASFAADGWTFIAQPAAEAPSQPITFRVTGATVAGQPLALHDARPEQRESRVERDCGGLVETVHVALDHVEQTFTFAALPARGELAISIAVATELTGVDLGEGIAFRSSTASVSYGEAVAIDANGARIAAPTTFEAGVIRIRVPADFVAAAKLPLVVDPRVTNATVRGDTVDLAEPDVAWDATYGVWAVSMQRHFSTSDWDMYVQLLDIDLNLVGAAIPIDFTGDRWQNGRIANLGAYDRFLVIAEVRAGTTPVRVRGRVIDGAGALLTTQFDIATAAVDSLHCDVGGDPATAPTYWTVVWEHAYSATDHDIYARQITSTGTLRGTGATIVQANTINQSWPSISKSDGAPPYADQRFTIVYQQAGANQDIYGSMLTWDGVFVPVAGSNTFLIDGSGEHDLLPEVSTPTLNDPTGLRLILAVYERATSNNGDVAVTCFDQAGNWRGSGNLNSLELNATRQLWPQRRPTVDSDGTRFAVVYHETFGGTGTDLDTRASLVAVYGGSVVVQEAGATLGFSSFPEFNVKMASRFSGSGVFNTRYCTTNDRDGGASPFSIDAYTYDGYAPGGLSTRPTACGVLPILASGSPLIGGAVSFDLQAGLALAGYVVGLPASIPIAPCPGCVLGANGSSVMGNLYTLNLPLVPAFAGVTLSVQGFVFAATGPCLGQIRTSDTVDITIQ